MHPRLFTIELPGHQLAVSTYGLLVAIGVMGGIYLGYRNAKRVGIRPDDYLDLTFWGLVVALACSRAMFVLTNLDRFRGDYLKVFAIWEGGLVFYGGVIGAVAFGLLMMWRRKLPFLRSGDVIAPVLSIGHAFGRLGCFMAGCCWGKACPRPLGVQFGRHSVVYENLAASGGIHPPGSLVTQPLHPVQLYEALGEIVIFGVLLHLANRKRFDGMVFFSYLVLYAALRSMTELFRGDAARRYIFELPIPALARLLHLPPGEPLLLSTSQLVSMVSAALALGGLLWLGRRAREQAAAAAVSSSGEASS